VEAHPIGRSWGGSQKARGCPLAEKPARKKRPLRSAWPGRNYRENAQGTTRGENLVKTHIKALTEHKNPMS